MKEKKSRYDAADDEGDDARDIGVNMGMLVSSGVYARAPKALATQYINFVL